MLSYLGLWSMLGYGYWAIKEKSTGRYVGDLGFADFHRDIEPSTRYIPEAGWALASWAQGKGYATEALLAAIHWLQNTREITSCLCLIEPDNLPSIKLAKRVGFKKSHTLRLNGELTELFILSTGNSTRDKIDIAIK
ncbi:Acetyltransferase (GNAT) family [Moellerella wisconsensis]|nr:Acetyltransferase (GNAT) family [Moellerella wisconsensis]